jgi:hypothetical protein
MASNMKVMNLWIIYLVVLVALSLIFYVLVSNNHKIGFGAAAFLAALISAIIVYFVAQYNVDLKNLTKDEQNSLNALYITMGVVLLIGFIWLIVSLASGNRSHRAEKMEVVEEIKASDCKKVGDHVECDKITMKEKDYDESGHLKRQIKISTKLLSSDNENNGSMIEEEETVFNDRGGTPSYPRTSRDEVMFGYIV